jgi:ribosomal protein S18 acetylase RimI-like enzyme
MEIRPFRSEDVTDLAALSATCMRGESDFVLNPLWQTEAEFAAEFERFGIDPKDHLLVADEGGDVLGLAGFLRNPGATSAGMFCPVVQRGSRGRGVGGELLRACQRLGADLGIELATAGIGTRNRAGYSLLTSHGFRPVRQHFMMRCNEIPSELEPNTEAEVALRAAGDDDAGAILEIYAACGFDARSLSHMRELMSDGRHTHSVAELDGEIAAFAEIETHWPARVWVAFVGVSPALRDRGFGSRLVAWTLARQFAAGAQSAILMLSPANRTALRAYEKVGFRRSRLIDVLEKSLK